MPNIRSGLQYNPSSQEGSIQIELEEIEAKEEDYPQTRAFLSLVDALTDVAVPSSLGMGHRVPGFNPYLEFIRDSVLLKFDTRAYKDPQEKVRTYSVHVLAMMMTQLFSELSSGLVN